MCVCARISVSVCRLCVCVSRPLTLQLTLQLTLTLPLPLNQYKPKRNDVTVIQWRETERERSGEDPAGRIDSSPSA